jgi:G3E family GTPase
LVNTHLILGAFGAGKTTAIRRLMARKPAQELWVVILNEFTEAGLDALAVAQSAEGRYDVRLIAGGCLCCVGELEFGKQIRDILRHLRPDRLLIEPSGAAHASQIIDELARYEHQGALRLDSVICLVDALDAGRLAVCREGNEWSQIQAADVLLLSKPDLADAAAHTAFASIVAAQYPAKPCVGSCSHGALPDAALQAYTRAPAFSLVTQQAAAPPPVAEEFNIAGLTGRESRVAALGATAVSWILPQNLIFSRSVLHPRLEWLLEAQRGTLQRVKGVMRTGPGPSWLFQSHGRGLAYEDSGYRRDSRLEILVSSAPTVTLLDAWRDMLRSAALMPDGKTSR